MIINIPSSKIIRMMSYWDRDWVCSDCKTEALSKTRTCAKCGKARPYPKASEAGPIDVTQP